MNQRFELVWLSLAEAIVKVENDKPAGYEGFLIQQRDLEFLKKAALVERGN